jgi:RHS repeat-associated protein
VRALTNASGAVTDTYHYDAFGNLIHSTGTTPNNYLFAGEQLDSDLNLYYIRARYLNTNTGRFWSMDAYEGNSSDPSSLHKYLYANADSVDLRDPAGNTPLSDFIAKAVQRGIEITARAYGVLAHTPIEADIEATYPEAQTEVFVPGGRIDVYIPPEILRSNH